MGDDFNHFAGLLHDNLNRLPPPAALEEGQDAFLIAWHSPGVAEDNPWFFGQRGPLARRVVLVAHGIINYLEKYAPDPAESYQELPAMIDSIEGRLLPVGTVSAEALPRVLVGLQLLCLNKKVESAFYLSCTGGTGDNIFSGAAVGHIVDQWKLLACWVTFLKGESQTVVPILLEALKQGWQRRGQRRSPPPPVKDAPTFA